MSTDQIKELQDNVASYRKEVELAEALNRLMTNRDFKKLFLEGYFREEAIRLVHLKADPAMYKPEKQADIIREMDAIGSLRSYLDGIQRRAVMAQNGINAAEAMITELENDVE